MKIKLKPYLDQIIVFCLAVVFFIGTSSFNYLTQEKGYTKWSSPDETANYFFTKRFANGENLAYFDPAAALGDNMVMPRSFRSDFGWLKPVSFLGIIIIYGTIAGLIGTASIPFLTPFFAALGIVFFYYLMRKIFSARVGLISAFLLASFPVYIYYSVRSMFHNVLFIVLTIVAVYLVLLAAGKKPAVEGQLEKKTWWRRFLAWRLDRKQWLGMAWAFLGGIFFGLALMTRTSEIIWLAPAAALVWIFYARRLGLIRLILILSGIFLAVMPNIYYNQVLYSSPFYGGYNEMNRSLDDLSQAGAAVSKNILGGRQSYQQYIEAIYRNVFYFGFKPQQSIAMARHYILEMFPYLSAAAALGWLLLIVGSCWHFRKKNLAYLLAFAGLSAILIFYYGSWKFNDNPDPSRFTIGNSYTRYWLPIYLMLIPIASLALVRVTRALFLTRGESKYRWKRLAIGGVQILAVSASIYWSLLFVLYGSEEGLAYLYYNNLAEKANAQQVFSLTEDNAVIITRYYDKYFFPDRRVIMGTVPDGEVMTAASKLIWRYPVYYYNFFLKAEDVAYLNDRKLPPYSLRMSLVKKMNHSFGLYKLERASATSTATSTEINK